MSKTLSVTVLNDGPLKISCDQVNLRYAGDDLQVEAGQDVYLCRCGKSANPPFCDGAHSREGFVAEPPTIRQRPIKVWEGKTIRTYFNPNACMHVYTCKPLKELRQRELEGDADAAAEIARVVEQCPSGALTYEAQHIETKTSAESSEVDIDIQEGGEVRIQCAFEINADLHERQPSTRGTLCRCGLSKNKPWCDGQHARKKDFR